MAQLKVKQISDFVTAVASVHNGAIGTDTVTGIANAKSEAISTAVSADVVGLSSAKSYADQAEVDAINSSVSQAEAKDASRALTAGLNISTAKSEAIASAESKDEVRATAANLYADQAEADAKTEAGRLDGIVLSSAKSHSNLQKDRIDALLLDSDATLDTFAEIKSFVDGLDTGDVAGLSAAISTGDSTAISTAFSADVVVLSSAKSYADVAEADAKAEAGRLDGIVLSSAKSYADVAEADANGYTDDRETSILSVLRGELEAVAGTDKLEQIATIAGEGFTTALQLSQANNDILVFVNGLQIHASIEGREGFVYDGARFDVINLGYALEANDHIVVIGIKA